MHTRVKVEGYTIKEGTVTLTLKGEGANIAVLKDRLGVKEDTTALTDSAVNRVKVSLSKLIERNFEESYTLKLKSLDNFSQEMIHVTMELGLATVPYPISVQYHIADDGYFTVSYSCCGDVDKFERWSSSSISADGLDKKLKEISNYYKNKVLKD